MKSHVVILLRDRSREWRLCGNWRAVSEVLLASWIVEMLFPRRERCSSLESEASDLMEDKQVMSLFSRVRRVMVLERGVVRIESWFAEAESVLRTGN